jgi:Flp pilus assembly protein TadB
MLSALASFGRFWYRFIVGDDWTIAASVFGAVIVIYLLRGVGLNTWWLMPLVVIVALGLSLYRAQAQQQRRSSRA